METIAKKNRYVRNLDSRYNLYNLDSLVRRVKRQYGISTLDCIGICDNLYKNGYITQPKTTCRYLKNDMKNEVDSILENLSSCEKYKTIINNCEQRTYSNHVFNSFLVYGNIAIIPTGKIPKSLSENEEKIYDLITKSLISAICKNEMIMTEKMYEDLKEYIFNEGIETVEEKLKLHTYEDVFTALDRMSEEEILTLYHDVYTNSFHHS